MSVTLKTFVTELGKRISFVEGKKDSDPLHRYERFRCIAANWLAKQLIPDPQFPKACPFLAEYGKNPLEFTQHILRPLIGNPFDVDSVVAQQGSLLDRVQAYSGVTDTSLTSRRLLRGLELRLATLDAFNQIAKGNDFLAVRFPLLLDAYRDFFGTRCWMDCIGFIPAKRSVALHAINSKDAPLAKILKEAVEAAETSCVDPAVAMVLDILALCKGCDLTRAYEAESTDVGKRKPGDTWVLFVLTGTDANDKNGDVMRLRMERLGKPGSGTGCVYPHPHLSYHYGISEQFQGGVRNAWLATIGETMTRQEPLCDYRWVLLPLEDSRKTVYKLPQKAKVALGIKNKELPEIQAHDLLFDKTLQQNQSWEKYLPNQKHIYLWKQLDGNSGTTAFALALRSAHQSQLLRKEIAASAAFVVPKQITKLSSGEIDLGVVGGVPYKADAMKRAGITNLIVAQGQTAALPLEAEKCIPKETFEEAYQAARIQEQRLEDYAQYGTQRWDALCQAAADASSSKRSEPKETRQVFGDPAVIQRQSKELRLDWYVDPVFAWQDLPEEELVRRIARSRALADSIQEDQPEESGKVRQVPGDRKDQLTHALQEWIAGDKKHKHKHLLLVDEAGAGKTIASYRMQYLMNHPVSREAIFGQEESRIVVHWSGKLPQCSREEPSLLDLLMEDTAFECIERTFYSSLSPEKRNKRRHKTLEYAIEQSRLLVIVDAYDELNERHRKILERIVQTDKNEVRFVITSRDYAVKEARSIDRFFKPDEFVCLQLQPFEKNLQDEFMQRAIGERDWRRSLQGEEESWAELLGLPYNLSEIAKYFLEFDEADRGSRKKGTGKAIIQEPSWISPSDLFVQCAQRMIGRELHKEENQQLIGELREKLNDRDFPPKKLCDQIERILGAVALEMAIKRHWREVQADDQSEEIEAIWDLVENRLIDKESDPRKKAKAEDLWNWGKEFTRRFQLHKGSTQGDMTERSLMFRNRRVQEMWAARYLTQYATERELQGAREYVGDEEWDNLWKCAVWMPLASGARPHGSTDTKYLAATQMLFDVPIHPQHRRPTEQMWHAEVFLDKQAKLGVPTAEPIAKELRKILTDRFAALQSSGTSEQKSLIAELLDPTNYVLLCSEDPNLRLDRETGEFVMGPDLYLEEEGQVHVKLTAFGIGKFTVTAEQFALFDPWLEVQQTPRLPAQHVSWFDSFFFVRFLSGAVIKLADGRSYRFRIPTEAQGEYATRAGSTGDYFIGKNGIEVSEKKLEKYAHFNKDWDTRPLPVDTTEKLPNAWGLMHPVGNVWQWRWDIYDEYKKVYPSGYAHNPSGPDSGSYRVYRGGCWSYGAANCRSAYRYGYDPSYRYRFHGFRLALSSSRIPQQVRKAGQEGP
ncbi:MAG: SUMF1/EgtB/PvdO family nonheme iron enzyme [Pirellula sp.]